MRKSYQSSVVSNGKGERRTIISITDAHDSVQVFRIAVGPNIEQYFRSENVGGMFLQ